MRKLLLFVTITFLLTGCANVLRTPVLQGSDSIDYSKYLNDGFFITEANSVSFTYKPISSVSAYFVSGYEIAMKDGKPVMNTTYTGYEYVVTTEKYILAKKEYIIEALVKEAKDKGANGIINLQIKGGPLFDPVTMKLNDSYSGSAMAIFK